MSSCCRTNNYYEDDNIVNSKWTSCWLQANANLKCEFSTITCVILCPDSQYALPASSQLRHPTRRQTKVSQGAWEAIWFWRSAVHWRYYEQLTLIECANYACALSQRLG